VDKSLINEQIGLRGGKTCTEQILNLTQSIEDGYKRKLVIGTVFRDLTAANDTNNHRILFKNMYKIISDHNLIAFIGEMIRNRRYFVEPQGIKSSEDSKK